MTFFFPFYIVQYTLMLCSVIPFMKMNFSFYLFKCFKSFLSALYLVICFFAYLENRYCNILLSFVCIYFLVLKVAPNCSVDKIIQLLLIVSLEPSSKPRYLIGPKIIDNTFSRRFVGFSNVSKLLKWSTF